MVLFMWLHVRDSSHVRRLVNVCSRSPRIAGSAADGNRSSWPLSATAAIRLQERIDFAIRQLETATLATGTQPVERHVYPARSERVACARARRSPRLNGVIPYRALAHGMRAYTHCRPILESGMPIVLEDSR
jgi:hypothetical protein